MTQGEDMVGSEFPRRTRPLATQPDDTLELRVHGVSGTPPDAMLAGWPLQVHGTTKLGVYRRVEDADPTEAAFWWGGLTSGRWWHAFWLLTLPLALVNVSGWMVPPQGAAGAGSGDDGLGLRRTHAVVARISGVAITILLAALLLAVTVDTVALGDVDALFGPGARVALPTGGWWLQASVAARVRTGALVSILALGFVLLVVRATHRRFEAMGEPVGTSLGVPPPTFGAADDQGRTMFHATDLAAPLRNVHLLAWVFPLLWVARTSVGGSRAWVWVVPATAIAGAVALSVSSSPRVAASVRWATGGMGAVAMGLSWWSLGTQPIVEGLGPGSSGTSDMVATGITLGVLALLVGFVTTWRASDVHAALRVSAAAVLGHGLLLALVSGLIEVVLWNGRIDEVTFDRVFRQWMSVGLLVAGIGAATLLLWHWAPAGSGSAAARSERLRATLVRAVSDSPWAVLPLLGWIPLVALFGVLAMGAVTSNPVGAVTLPVVGWDVAVPSTDLLQRSGWLWVLALPLVAVLVRSQAWPTSARVAAWLALVVAAPAGLIAYQRVAAGSSGIPPLNLVSVAVAVCLLGPLVAIAYVMVRGRSDATTMRAIGIVWDLLMFWPRWFHPWAPPPYTEAAVPALQELLGDRDLVAGQRHLLLSAHSQGAVLAYAAIANATDAAGEGEVTALRTPPPVSLLTYGQLIGAHYRTLFPTYFSPDEVARVHGRLEGRWLNLFRTTDPLGQPIDPTSAQVAASAGFAPPTDTVPPELPLVDEGAPDAPNGHSDYPHAPAFDQAMAWVVAVPPADPPAGAGP